MEGGPWLVHGIAWDGPAEQGGAPSLRMAAADGAEHEVALTPGLRLGWRVLDGRVHCLGFTRVHSARTRTRVPCPDRALAAHGAACPACEQRDDTRLIHAFHRTGKVPEGLRDYLMQPHWLYVAMSAAGKVKIGTASSARRWNRLAEQGAAAAVYVAAAADGRVVRVLEDAVTAGLGIGQAISSAAKLAAFASPLPAPRLAQLLDARAAEVTGLLGEVGGIGGFDVVRESWQPPAAGRGLLSETPRSVYPADPAQGDHALTLASVLGPFALGSAGPAGESFVAHLGRLRGRVIGLGPFESALQPRQTPLF
ncbi:hypothetical protein J2W21_002222 [Sinomonas atrocyanea]|uniref:DUF2797 domain-containing protein n=1 Tax=Sinomonas atrocyanea TaxID=37927 RepID=UPI00278A29D3|nr:DUF2797 domain-containing protein [Sinomonas atrocyanea]MDP9884708.1 hypothetical protein [Sinomonas atrocyanea]